MAIRNLSRQTKNGVAAAPTADAGYVEPESEYYYDWHPTKEDLMAESPAQTELADYIKAVLRWQYREQDWFVVSNLGIYRSRDIMETPLAPDVALFKGLVLSRKERQGLRSWKMVLPNRPAPTVVFELSSKKTWREDLQTKPNQYHTLGVQEYFAYDPNEPTLWTEKRKRLGVRLRGWRYEGNVMLEMTPDREGRLWSAELDSWLGSDGEMLRFYDKEGRLRLTKAEAKEAAEEVAERARDDERTAKEAERTAKEKAWAKLRELGIDPQTL